VFSGSTGCETRREQGLNVVMHTDRVLVGRNKEIEELLAGLSDAEAGHGRFVIIEGPAGIGKTRIAEEFALLVRKRGALALWSRCWEAAGAPAYWPWIQAIKSIARTHDVDSILSALAGRTYGVDRWREDSREVIRGGQEVMRGGEVRHLRAVRISKASNTEVARPPASGSEFEQERFRLFSSVAASLKEAARIRSLALVLDDLHDADQSSLLMLQFVARELRDARVAIVGTFREVEVERSKTLSSLMARIAREGTHLPLRGLAEPDIADFVAIRLGSPPAPKLVTMLHQATGGNPLFLDGVVRMLMAQNKLGNTNEIAASELCLPAGVRIAIRRQIDSLAAPAQQAARRQQSRQRQGRRRHREGQAEEGDGHPSPAALVRGAAEDRHHGHDPRTGHQRLSSSQHPLLERSSRCPRQ